jgi:hypothetical protein
MKRYFLIGLALVTILALNISFAVAQDTEPDPVPPNSNGVNFVDDNGDGICDNCGSGSRGAMNGNQGANFVDEDGDGICDNCGTGSRGAMNGNQGPNFVDQDGDGICDNIGTGSRSSGGRGRGRMGNGNGRG